MSLFIDNILAKLASIYSGHDSFKSIGDTTQLKGTIIDDLSRIASAINAGTSMLGFGLELAKDLAGYLGQGGTAAGLANIIRPITGAGLAIDVAASLLKVGDLYARGNEEEAGFAATKLILQIYFAGAVIASGGSIGFAALVFTFVGLDFELLLRMKRDPLILDLDNDGIEVSALDGSAVYFDYGSDGVAERTGWVSPDDGMLAYDANGNGVVDGIHELFGSPTQDGFEVLETLDANQDGVIDALDPAFAALRVWRDLNQNGVSDAGELQTLAEAGITSFALTRTDVTGSNAGHDRGFASTFTRAKAAGARPQRRLAESRRNFAERRAA